MEVAVPKPDRFGFGWRAELAMGMLLHLDEIDIVEVIAEDYFERPELLGTLARQVPVTLHGVGLGPASASAVDEVRLGKLARLVERVRPDSWSEHLAWVRGGGREIGHLAAPCRNAGTVEGTLRNIERMRRVMGSEPVLENVATLIDPPASPMGEAEWLREVLDGAPGTGMLLDLHNVHANATNFGFDAGAFLRAVPMDRVRTVHLAGGRMWRGRLLDDHLHDVPEPVFQLLEEAAYLAPQPLTVLIERDGRYEGVDSMLMQLREARRAVARGRERRLAGRAAA
ncbi:UPF0276 protein [Bryobacterales bacterium F-183]|nr:UPF0276 protein [Bryobacterales bacterium F-183]